MSIWNGIKKAFGFSPDEDEEVEEYDPSVPTYAVKREDSRPVKESSERSENSEDSDSAVGSTDIDRLPADLFDAVIEIFNATMPEFVASSLNTDAQRRYICERIDASLRLRVAQAVAPASAADESERQEMIRTIESLSDSRDEVIALREEVRKLRSNADRQKRAFTDRIADLDNQLHQLTAEKERILTSRKPVAAQPDAAALESKDNELAALQKQMHELNGRIAQLEAELNEERAIKEQLELKASMSDAMINDLQATASQAKEELAAAEASLAVVADIQDKLDQFEEIKKRKDAKIAELSATITNLSTSLEQAQAEAKATAETSDAGEIARLRDENASLSHTIETNLYNQANSEMKLRAEIKQLSAKLEKAEQQLAAAESHPALIEDPAAPAPAKRRRRRARKSTEELDGDLDSTDWLDVPVGSKKFDPDFGYHEPSRTIVPDNEAQLSLF